MAETAAPAATPVPSPTRRKRSDALHPHVTINPVDELLSLGTHRFSTVLADPPWRFTNRTGKMAPEHKRLSRYGTMDLTGIQDLPVSQMVTPNAHLYLWVPNALLPDGLETMRRWGFRYVSNLIWYKVTKDLQKPDRRGVGFYFRNVTEVLLFGVRGSMRTLKPGRTQANVIVSHKRGHSIKPDEQFQIIESCSPGPYLELFARRARPGWTLFGDQAPHVDREAVRRREDHDEVQLRILR